jgi:hypothetical protein
LNFISLPQRDHLAAGHEERGRSPDPQGFLNFRLSNLCATASNRRRLKELAKVELPYFFLQVQRGNGTSISFSIIFK